MRKIQVEVKPRSKKEGVEQLGDDHFLVRVNRPPAEGEANERTQELLAKFLKVPKSHLELVSGHKSKQKTFIIYTQD